MESALAALERKAKIYEKLSKGKSGGLSDKQYETLLVDVSKWSNSSARCRLNPCTQFDSKPIGAYDSDSDDVDESLSVPKPPGDDVSFL